MANTTHLSRAPDVVAVDVNDDDSAVAWSAVLAGAVAAAGLSLILFTLGAGLGFSSVSPWADRGVSATALGVSTVIWLVIVQWAASVVGGYLAGRLRKRTSGVVGDETFFRDTAHGFLAWCAATLFTAAFLASALSTVVGTGAQVASGAAQGATSAAVTQAQQPGPAADPAGYFVDVLFRGAQPTAQPLTPETRAEAGRILTRGVTTGDFPAADRTYLAQLVVARTGLPEAEAQRRVDEVVRQVQAAEQSVRDAADRARKAAAVTSIALALSLFVGAFIASVAAAYGGRLRDEV